MPDPADRLRPGGGPGAGNSIKTADFTTDTDAAPAPLKSSGDATWDSASNKLTLNGVNFTTSAGIAVQVPADTIIKPADENTITSVCDGVDFSYGICARNSLTIEAGGQLTAISGESILRSCGIFVYCENLAITGGTTGTAFSPDAACTRAQIVKFLYRCLG